MPTTQQIVDKTIENEYKKLHPEQGSRQETTLLTINVKKINKKPKDQQKISNKKRYIFLEHYAKTGNFTQSALKTGHMRQAFHYLVKEDEVFKQAYDLINQAFLDQAEECNLTVALQPSRDGFNDRKLLLQSKRSEVYGNKVEINKNQHITIDMNIKEMNQVLTSKSTKPKVVQPSNDMEDIDFVDVTD